MREVHAKMCPEYIFIYANADEVVFEGGKDILIAGVLFGYFCSFCGGKGLAADLSE